MSSRYQFPVTNKFEARAVTEPDFEPGLFDGDNELYVDLDDVRGRGYIREIEYDLGIEEGELLDTTEDYVKIIFSGHRGCGKTTELKRLHQRLNTPTQYAAIFISLEEETEYSRFEAEEFYLLLIAKLIERLAADGINVNIGSLERLGQKLFTSELVKKEISSKFAFELGTENEAGINLFGWLKSKANFKAFFAGESKGSREIKREIRQNTHEIIMAFNELIVDVRQALIENNKGKDILYFIDGSEKIRFEVYERIFVQDASLIEEISTKMIMSIRIDAFYKILSTPQNFPTRYVVPMIQLENPEARLKLKQIIERRLDYDTFFDADALDYIVTKSGGCVRQLFILANMSLKKSRGSKITLDHAQRATKEMGANMRVTLNTKHLKILTEGKFEPAETETGEMLYSLALLKYNGHESIKINPVLEGLI